MVSVWLLTFPSSSRHAVKAYPAGASARSVTGGNSCPESLPVGTICPFTKSCAPGVSLSRLTLTGVVPESPKAAYFLSSLNIGACLPL